MRDNVIAVGTIAFSLTIVLLVGAWMHPPFPLFPASRPVGLASVSLLSTLTSTPIADVPDDATDLDAPIPTPPPDAVNAPPTSPTPAAGDVDPAGIVSGVLPKIALVDTPIASPGTSPLGSESDLSTSRRSSSPTGTVPVLMYHYIRVNPVASDKAGFILSVATADFAKQIQFLASHGYTTVTMADIRQYLRSGKKLPPKPIALTFDDGYDDAYTAALPVLERYHMTATFYIVTGFVDKPRYVTWDQVTEMDRAGMEIASHTVRHPGLPFLAPLARQAELTESRATLEARLGHSVLDFCYPGGQFDVATEQAVARAGYLSATTTQYGLAGAGDDPFRVPRVRISGGVGLAEFARLIGERVYSDAPRTVSPTVTPTAMALATKTPTPTHVAAR